MTNLSSNYLSLENAYLFSKIEALTKGIDDLLNLGIGDITRPLSAHIGEAICSAVQEMTRVPNGYGPGTGYSFLKQAILKNGYEKFDEDEIFISDGISTDLAALPEIFEVTSVAITNPTYPLYRDCAVMAGHKILEIPCLEEHGFVPLPPNERVDLVYLCSPQNPLGVALTPDQMKLWVDYAIENESIILFDAAYKAFSPYSIYDVPGAERVVIELCSFSKSAGFTGLRCGYTVVPKAMGGANDLFRIYKETKTNGVSYPIQRGAEAALSSQGLKESFSDLSVYQKNAKNMHDKLCKKGYTCYGGEHSPYLWWKIPTNMGGWAFCEHLVQKHKLITVPGVGFGTLGEGYMRLSAFAKEETIDRALEIL